MSQISKPVLSLKQFILKQEVKNLYRNILRSIRKIPDGNHRKELIEWARRDFRVNAHYTDEITIKMYIRYGERCLRELETSLNLAK
ncbi:LYR motif-containing protein 2 [Anoplophora glabripennis]|uniref:LYR motif-containing protein 2 n=1 Tax=Anoplophora glabripennis TaxID=217634 RepID=UPI000874F1E2|nr:LYR motif-containing protein 2 [Anoplophora glabripennis]XP_018565459.1 LYR motif-containing protein 2 [Anoplophora glabripennis]